MKAYLLHLGLLLFTLTHGFGQLVISEIMYNPLGQNGIGGSDLEFVELSNIGTETLDIGGYTFVNGITFTIPLSTTIAPNEYLVIARNNAALSTVYPTLNIVGQYTGALSNSGETLTIENALGEEITTVGYKNSSPWPILANGIGYSLVYDMSDNDQDKRSKWRNSSLVNGTPGTASSNTITAYPIEINEILTNTNNLGVDKIELINTSNTDIDISNWFLGDNPNYPIQFSIPSNTIIPAGGFIVFDENDLGFGLSSNGDEIYLLSTSNGSLDGWATGYSFDAQEANRSFGQYTNSIGETFLTTLESQTFNDINSEPLIGPLVFEKIMYHPLETGNQYDSDEFIVIKNISDSIIALNNTRLADSNAFQITGISFKFSQTDQKEMQPNERIILTEIAPNDFITKYNIPANTQVFQYTGTLSNSGETLQIRYPLSQDINLDGSYDNHYVIMDEVEYNDKLPWPEEADGNGYYLARKGILFGTDPNSWKAVNSTVLNDDFNVLALFNHDQSGDLFIYPNPSNGSIRINTSSSIKQVNVMNTQGLIVLTTQKTNEANLESLPAGIYLIEVILDNGDVQHKQIMKN